MTLPGGIEFGRPWLLLLLLIVPVLLWLLGRPGRPGALRYSSAALLRSAGVRPRFGPRELLWMMRTLVLVLVIIAIAEPRKPRSSDEQRKYGIDVVLCCDTSLSMEQKDFYMEGKKVRRIDALLEAIGKFVDARPNDRTGMVGFAGEAAILSPLTLDASWVKEILAQVPLTGNTAVGEGLFAAVDVLKGSKEKSKVIVLVTDGESNAGRPPADAAEYAKKNGIRIYALEIQSFSAFARSQADKSPLAKIAQITGGQNFAASNTQALVSIYQHIDMLEKHRFEQKQFRLYDQLYPWFAISAMAIALFELLSGSTWLLRVP